MKRTPSTVASPLMVAEAHNDNDQQQQKPRSRSSTFSMMASELKGGVYYGAVHDKITAGTTTPIPHTTRNWGFGIRSGAPLRIRLAASLVDDAYNGRYEPDYKDRGDRALVAQWLHHNLAIVRAVAIFVYMALAVFEQPTWCFHVECPRGLIDSGVPRLSAPQSLAIECACLIVILFSDAVPKVYFLHGHYRQHRLFFFKLVCVMVALIDALGSFAYDRNIRLSAMIRPFIFIITIQRIRRVAYVVLRSIPAVLDILVLIAALILYFAWITSLLFLSNSQRVYFRSYGTAVSSLQIALTTANFPDVMLPAYSQSRAWVLLFVAFFLMGLWFLVPLTLATVYSSYRDQLEAQRTKQRTNRALSLRAAFIVMDTERCGYLPLRDIVSLFSELNRYSGIRYVSMTAAAVYLRELDTDHTGVIRENEFDDLIKVLSRSAKTSLREFYAHRHRHDHDHDHNDDDDDDDDASMFNITTARRWRLNVRRVVVHPRFEMVVDAVVAVNFFLAIVESVLVLNEADGSENAFTNVEFVFLGLYLVEAATKIGALGWERYWHGARNRFDFVFLVGTICVEAWLLIPNNFNDDRVIRYLVMVRSLRLLRFLSNFNRFQVIMGTYVRMVPKFLALFALLVGIAYLYAEIGMAVFGGKLTPSTNAYGSDHADYYVLNFNDFVSSIVTLFCLLLVNNWFVFQDAYIQVTNEWARIFFISFYLIGVVLVLNVVVAFIIDVFTRESDKFKKQHPGVNHPQQPPQPNADTGINQ